MAILSGLAGSLPDAVLFIDLDGVLKAANPAAERLFGVRARDRVGTPCFDLIHPGDLELAVVSMISMSSHEVGTPLELRVQTPDGWRLVELLGAQVSDPDHGDGILLCIRDLTDRRRWEIAAGDEAVFRALLQNAVGLTVLVSADGDIITTSAAITRALGHDPGVVTGRRFDDLVVIEDQGAFHRAFDRVRADGGETVIEARLRRREGAESVPYQLVLVNLLDDPTVAGIVVTGHEITELRAAREELARLAFVDALTGLPNRGDLMRELETRLRPRRMDPLPVMVAFLDLDRFKPVNDLFGHAVGDELLVAFGRRLRARLRSTDYVARFGGDEFVVLADPTGEDAERGLVERLEAAASEPFGLSVGTVQVFASIGVVHAKSGDSLDDVLAEADAAMYAEKHRRRGVDGGRNRSVIERRSLAESVEAAFERHEFELWYQPIVSLGARRTQSFEALVRWQHPELGLLAPGVFLDVIEDLGRDNELAEYVLRRAAHDLGEARRRTGQDLTFAVNASANQFTDPDFPDLVTAEIARAGVPASALTIEISERSIMERPANGPAVTAEAGLEAIAARGVKIAVDDFGTGYSSLSHLVMFPIDSIKVDRSFVGRMIDEEQCQSVVAALVGLARSMRVEIVAEGVETTKQLRALTELGCDLAQGYLFSKPVPFDDAMEWLAANDATVEALAAP